MSDPSGHGSAALPEIHIRPTECAQSITAQRKRKENSTAAKRHTAALAFPPHSDVSALPSSGSDGDGKTEGVFGDTPPLFLLPHNFSFTEVFISN